LAVPSTSPFEQAVASLPKTLPTLTRQDETNETNDARICAFFWPRTTVNRRLVVLMLKKLGYKADQVANGREVIKALNDNPTI
jgi:hypothetical protein